MSSPNNSGWVDLGDAVAGAEAGGARRKSSGANGANGGSVGFTAKLENVTGFPLFAKSAEEAKKESECKLMTSGI